MKSNVFAFQLAKKHDQISLLYWHICYFLKNLLDFVFFAKRRRTVSETLLTHCCFASCHVCLRRNFRWRTRVSLHLQLLAKQLNWCLQFLHVFRNERVLIRVMFSFWIKSKAASLLPLFRKDLCSSLSLTSMSLLVD